MDVVYIYMCIDVGLLQCLHDGLECLVDTRHCLLMLICKCLSLVGWLVDNCLHSEIVSMFLFYSALFMSRLGNRQRVFTVSLSVSCAVLSIFSFCVVHLNKLCSLLCISREVAVR